MSRPLTAADRAPQVGDVMYYSRLRWSPLVVVKPGFTKDGAQKFGYQPAEVTEPKGYWTAHVMERYFYLSRADGGPITTDEDTS